MSIWSKLMGVRSAPRVRRSSLNIDALETRSLMSANPLPVLLVIADSQDFYYKEYGDTRLALENAGVEVVVAATTTNTSYPHPNSGQNELGIVGAVTPDIALADADASDYSAIAFVGGWGSSMYQYAYNDPNFDGVLDNFYWHGPYNGDANLYDGIIAPQKVAANDLINEFLASDKPVAAICHGVTVLAWARVDGVSPLAGKQVSVPLTVGSPGQHYNNGDRWYPYYSGQYDQVVANGGIANTISGQYGPLADATDDVVVDGRIITAENYDSALAFGATIADEVWANVTPPANQAPTIAGAAFAVPENSAVGTVVGQVLASDPDAGQTLSYSIIAGNTNNAFSIDSNGMLMVANMAALNHEALPEFTLSVRVVDDGNPAMEATATVVVNVTNVYEPATFTAGHLVLHGTGANDVIYVWSNLAANSISATVNGQHVGPFVIGAGGSVSIHGYAGDDQLYATDVRIPVTINGGQGHDKITGGKANDLLKGEDGVDRLWGGFGDDTLLGGAGNDCLYGREGNDLLLGGDGDDYMEGFDGRDVLLGGLGSDNLRGLNGDDLLIGGLTSYDNDPTGLITIHSIWSSPNTFEDRIMALTSPLANVRLISGDTVQDDGAKDVLVGLADSDWLFESGLDYLYQVGDEDHVSV